MQPPGTYTAQIVHVPPPPPPHLHQDLQLRSWEQNDLRVIDDRRAG